MQEVLLLLPELDLPPLHLSEAAAYLVAVMYRPRNPDEHPQMVATMHNTAMKRVLRRRNPASIPNELQPAVVAAAIGPDFDDITYRQEDPHNLFAGFLLSYVLACAEAGDEPATLENARKVLSTAANTKGSVPGRSRSKLIECWNQFSPAAHLIAARVLFPKLWDEMMGRGAAVAAFLALAEALRARGEAHRPNRSKTTLLNPAETWKVPRGLVVLPEISLPPLPNPSLFRTGLALPSPVD